MKQPADAGRRRSATAESRSLERFELPERHPDLPERTPGRAWLTVMEGCDLFCTFCIVPRTRGREISRPAAAILAEARWLAEQGVREVTLLGQTVNAYGRHELRREPGGSTGCVPFAELLSALDAISGLRRVRYTSPHPAFFTDALIEAHAELPSLQPHVHLPLQSGSDRVNFDVFQRRVNFSSVKMAAGIISESGAAPFYEMIVDNPSSPRQYCSELRRVQVSVFSRQPSVWTARPPACA